MEIKINRIGAFVIIGGLLIVNKVLWGVCKKYEKEIKDLKEQVESYDECVEVEDVE